MRSTLGRRLVAVLDRAISHSQTSNGLLACPADVGACPSRLYSLLRTCGVLGTASICTGGTVQGQALGGTPSSLSDKARARLQQIQERQAALVRQLSDADAAVLDAHRLTALHRELGELQPAVEALQTLSAVEAELQDLQELLRGADSDEELRRLAESERRQLIEKLPALEKEVLLTLLPKDATDSRNTVLEIRAGTGGDEAALFAADLLRMYAQFCAHQGWRFEMLETSEGVMGGIKQASAEVSGHGVYGLLKWESGVHRVQRVPATEGAGRVHTSAASVAVLPQADALSRTHFFSEWLPLSEISMLNFVMYHAIPSASDAVMVEVGLRDEDVRVDTHRASGAGGQHVNTTNSAVRLTHLPTGLVVSIQHNWQLRLERLQDERSQHRNKAKAMKVLLARLYERARQEEAQSQSAQRMGLIGSGDRSERIRTYNFPQGRVTDHRIGLTEHGIEAVLSGERLSVFIDTLQQHHQDKLMGDSSQG